MFSYLSILDIFNDIEYLFKSRDKYWFKENPQLQMMAEAVKPYSNAELSRQWFKIFNYLLVHINEPDLALPKNIQQAILKYQQYEIKDGS